MDEQEFNRLLHLFPVIRSRDYHIELDPSRQFTSRPPQDEVKKWQDAWEDPRETDKKESENHAVDLHNAFWEKLKLSAERKVEEEEAKRFCDAFQQIHKRLVYQELSLDAARSFVNSRKSSG